MGERGRDRGWIGNKLNPIQLGNYCLVITTKTHPPYTHTVTARQVLSMTRKLILPFLLFFPSSLIFKPPSSSWPRLPSFFVLQVLLYTLPSDISPSTGAANAVTALKGHSLLHLRLQNACLLQYAATNVNECQIPPCWRRLVAVTGLPGRYIM